MRQLFIILLAGLFITVCSQTKNDSEDMEKTDAKVAKQDNDTEKAVKKSKKEEETFSSLGDLNT